MRLYSTSKVVGGHLPYKDAESTDELIERGCASACEVITPELLNRGATRERCP
jgi:hypothetical protein